MADENIYKAPDAELQVDNSDADEFFPVSVRKLWIMHLLTFGAYDFYWFYRHWDHYRLKNDRNVWPAVRGLFFFLFVYPTFNAVQKAAEAKQLGHLPNLRIFALIYYVLLLGSILISVVYRDTLAEGVALSLTISIAGNVLTGYLFTSMQGVANRVIDDPAGEKNSRITALNIVWIVVLLLLNALSLLGRVVPQP